MGVPKKDIRDKINWYERTKAQTKLESFEDDKNET